MITDLQKHYRKWKMMTTQIINNIVPVGFRSIFPFLLSLPQLQPRQMRGFFWTRTQVTMTYPWQSLLIFSLRLNCFPAMWNIFSFSSFISTDGAVADTYANTDTNPQRLVYPTLSIPDSKVRGAHIGPTWVLPAPDGPNVGPMNLAIRDIMVSMQRKEYQ